MLKKLFAKKEPFFNDEKDFVDIRLTKFKVTNLPPGDQNGLRNTFTSVKLVSQKKTLFQGKTEVVKKNLDPRYGFKRGFTLQKSDFLNCSIQFMVFEYAFLKPPKLVCSCTLQMKDDFIFNTDRLKLIYDPFYACEDDPIVLDLETNRIKVIEDLPTISFCMKLFSYSLKFDTFLLSTEDEKVICIVLNHIRKQVQSAIANPTDHTDSEINFMGRMKDHNEFLKQFNACLNSSSENIKTVSLQVEALYKYLHKNEYSKFEIVKEPVKDEKKNFEKEYEQFDEDKKELEIYLSNGYDKHTPDKEYYEMNMLRIILKLQNSLQARKFFEMNCKDSKKLVNLELVSKDMSEGAAFYNAMIIRRERNRNVAIGRTDDVIDKLQVRDD
jgi:hypothetical protein